MEGIHLQDPERNGRILFGTVGCKARRLMEPLSTNPSLTLLQQLCITFGGVLVLESREVILRNSFPPYFNRHENCLWAWIATCYMLTVWGSNPSVGEIFCTCPGRPWRPPSLLYNGYQVSFLG
jgi:hypothetical protein